MAENEEQAPQFNFEAGELLLVDKPVGWTSFDVVNKLRYACKAKKVGHAGTLDPLATGLLIICTGKKTKELTDLTGQDKEYTGTIVLGATTPSYDLETEPDASYPTEHITPEALQQAVAALTGQISQLPPLFSAITVKGKRLYEHARAGQQVEVQPRQVVINEFELTRIELPEVDFRVNCSKGTYIRSLAFDLGRAVGSGGYLKSLRRTRSGSFSVANAWQLPRLLDAIKLWREQNA